MIDAMIVPISCTCMSKLNPHAEPPTPATITEMMRVRICLAESRYSLSIARMVPAYSVNCIPSSATMTRPSKRLGEPVHLVDLVHARLAHMRCEMREVDVTGHRVCRCFVHGLSHVVMGARRAVVFPEGRIHDEVGPRL